MMHQPSQFKTGDRIRHKGFRGTITIVKGDFFGMVQWENGSISPMNFRQLELIESARNQRPEPKGRREKTN
jgi:hypothetical protein